ncbi:MAG: signal peptidase I [Candidatus Taylorbacteria bacterium RIFCSPHIGHO2_01_FULL_46_22b]|uniref:Signal peptidase I n=1 Tax=Candidatus Taylorbacteria bacterium RIFCSPHIGHO2_01_FULL_46_22b TaxID=1802301 RepID=A0A1G2M4F6_9BACT|nr:MAG: signal peptidase I [Candidatus Taylorbacteria bacterium RIFCSPHIGHO2_01_FULL_46_22b]
MSIIGKILYGLFVVLLVGVAGLFLVSLLPITGNIEIKIVKSGSMEPTILTGSVVVVKPQTLYKVGDVITFGEDTPRQIPTTHRIVSIRESSGQTYFLTKGDANEEADPTETSASDVIGKVLVDVPYLGFVLDFARKPIGFTLLIGIPASLIILDESTRIIREVMLLRRKRKKETDL